MSLPLDHTSEIERLQHEFQRQLRGRKLTRSEAIEKAIRSETTVGMRACISAESTLYNVRDLEEVYAPVIEHIRSKYLDFMAEQSA